MFLAQVQLQKAKCDSCIIIRRQGRNPTERSSVNLQLTLGLRFFIRATALTNAFRSDVDKMNEAILQKAYQKQ